jgi:hypothetical protein
MGHFGVNGTASVDVDAGGILRPASGALGQWFGAAFASANPYWVRGSGRFRLECHGALLVLPRLSDIDELRPGVSFDGGVFAHDLDDVRSSFEQRVFNRMLERDGGGWAAAATAVQTQPHDAV